jgi:small subunit ribosomal protein S6
MRRYETVAIIDPEIQEENRQPVFQRIQDIIHQDNGFLVELDEWGTKKLAYEIKSKPRGFYVCINYCGTGPTVDELERFFRIDDRVLKFLTVMLEEDIDLEKIKAEVAQAEAERQEREAQRAAEEAAAREAAETEKAAAAQAEPPAPQAETEKASAETEPAPAEADTAKTSAATDATAEADTAETSAAADATAEDAEPEKTPDTAENKEG